MCEHRGQMYTLLSMWEHQFPTTCTASRICRGTTTKTLASGVHMCKHHSPIQIAASIVPILQPDVQTQESVTLVCVTVVITTAAKGREEEEKESVITFPHVVFFKFPSATNFYFQRRFLYVFKYLKICKNLSINLNPKYGVILRLFHMHLKMCFLELKR